MRKYFLLLIITLVVVCGTTTALAVNENSPEDIQKLNNTIKDRKDKIKELQDAIDKYKKQISQKELEATSLKNQLSILDSRINEIEAEVAITRERLETTKLELSVLGYTVDEKTTHLEKQKSMVSSMVRKIQEDDQKNTLEIMLTNPDFAGFYSQLKNLEDVYTDLGRTTRALRLSRDEIVQKQKEVDDRRQAYERYQTELENKKQDLHEQVQARESLLTSTKESEQQYKTLLGSLKQQYQSVEGEVRTYEEQVRKKLEEQKKIKENVSGASLGLSWPVASRYITARFHDVSYPFRRVFEHNAIDIRASQGTEVRAATSGYIGRARRCSVSTCYSYVLIVHTGNISTVYGHLSKILVNEDDFVNKGDLIGYSGGTPGTVGAGPFVTGAHLHFEVRLNGIPVDPLGYLTE
jgi:murein DD-endopeptidase MepM/ murein hydrolase activator NlpD